MKILYDDQIFNLVNYGGISRYFYELMKGIIRLGHKAESTTTFSENIYTKDQEIFNSREFLPNINFKGKYLVKKILNRINNSEKIRKSNFDLFHPTYYNSYFVDKISKKPFVITFHDLIHEKFRNQFPDQLSVSDQFFKDRIKLLNHSSKIITISKSTKQDLIELYNVEPTRINIIPLANSLDSSRVFKDKSLGDYILFVGVRRGYKNFNLFIRSIAPILVKEKFLKVICAGGGAFSAEELRLFHDLNISKSLEQVPIDDSKLAQLYHNALFFVFPSLYEGFGIPILESFSCSCPALIGNTSSLPEVGGDAALYVDASSKEDIYDKVNLFLHNECLRKDKIVKGLDRVKHFSWDKTSRATLETYKSLL